MILFFKKGFLIFGLTIFFLTSGFAQSNTLNTLGLTSSSPATVAFSVRQLSSGYSGPLMRIRNSSNNDLYDVWPDGSGQFSSTSVISAPNPGTTPGTKNGTTALSTIISGTTFTVAIWYDQSGNANNLTQSTASNQPTIISTGTIQTESSKPFIRFYGTKNSETVFNSLSLSSSLTTNGHVSIVNKFASGGDGFILGSTSNYMWHNDLNNLKLLDVSLTSTSVTNSSIWQNGTSVLPTNAVWNTSLGINTIQPQTANSGTDWENIGRDRDFNHTLGGGGYAELIVFSAALSTSDRQAIESTQSTYFNIAFQPASLLSGTTSICSGSSTNLSVAITGGTSPFTVVYSNGTSNTTVSSYTSGSNISVSPTTNTTYSLVSVTDANGVAGTGISGSAVVTVTAAPVVTGLLRNASLNGLNFDGSNDNISSNCNSYATTSELTYELWIKPNAFGGVISIINHSGWAAGYVHFQFHGSQISFDINGGNDNACTYTFSTGTWYHIAAVYSATAHTLTFYVNGNLQNTITNSGFPNIAGSVPLTIGSWDNSRYFNGTLDEVRIWNTARTQSQIQDAINSELSGSETGLVAYYNFNQGTASGTNTGLTTLIDNSFKGNNLALNNFALSGSTSNWVAGKNLSNAITNATLKISNTIQLSNSTPSGTWSTTDANVATVDNTGLVTGISIGTATISYTVTNVSNCSTASTASISVIASPVVTSQTTPAQTVCQNTTASTYSVTATGSSLTYQWYSNTTAFNSCGTLIPSATSSSYVPPASSVGTKYYYCIVISSNGLNSTSNVSGAVIVNSTSSSSSITVGAASSSPTLNVYNPLTNITHTTTGATNVSNSGVSGANGLPTGVSAAWASDVVTVSGTPSVSGTFNYTIPLVTGSNCSVVSATGTIVVLPLYTWTGAASDNLWSTGGNWSTGVIPNATSQIVISSGTPKLDIDFEVGTSLTLSGTGIMTINAGKTLSIASTATADFGGKSVTFKSDAAGSAQMGQMLGTLSNASNVTVERHIPASNRTFRLISSPVTTTTSIKENWMENATLSVVSGYPYAGGSLQNPNAGYGTHITGATGNAAGFDETYSNSNSLFTHDNTNAAWNAVTTTAGTLAAGDAYRIQIRGDRSYAMFASPLPAQSATTLRTTGTLKTGSKTVNLNTTADGFSMIGNPYQSTVDLYAAGITKTNITGYYYIWDPRMATKGAYVAYSTATGRSNSASAVNQYLQPGQAIFVQTSSSGGAASITFDESAKSIASKQSLVFSRFKGNAGVEFGAEPNAPQATYTSLNTTIYYTDSLATGAMPMDGLKVMFDNTFSNVVDQVDAKKMYNLDETMSVLRDGTNLSIELMNKPDSTTVIPLSITNYRTQKYTFRMQWTNPYVGLNNKVTAYVKDKYTGLQYEINNTTATDIPYTVDAAIPTSFEANRFDIVFKPTALVVLPIAEIALTAAVQQNGIKLQWTNPYDKDLSKYEVERSADGRVFTKVNTQAGGNGIQKSIIYNWFDATPIEGYNYYRVKGLALNNGKTQWSNNLKIRSWTVNIGTAIVPNPAERTGLNVKTDLPKGYYDMKLIDSRGRVVYTKGVEYNGLGGAIELRYGVQLAAGTYYLHIEGMGERVVRTAVVQ